MGIIGFCINGISVSRENGHYLLQKNGIQMRCDIGELNECIPEFEEYMEDQRQRKQRLQVTGYSA